MALALLQRPHHTPHTDSPLLSARERVPTPGRRLCRVVRPVCSPSPATPSPATIGPMPTPILTPAPAPARLHGELLAFLGCGLSVHVGACNRTGEPQVVRALALRIEPDHRVSLLLSTPSADGLLAAISEVPVVAMTACQPSTHRAIQVKGRGAELSAADPAQWAERLAFKDRFLAEIEPYGYDEVFVDAWLDVPPEQWRVVTFTPTGAWNQTPGPGAGQAMPLHEEPAR